MPTFRDWIRRAQGKAPIERPPEPPPQQAVYMPEGVDFGALWADQETASGLGTIIAIGNSVVLVIVLVRVFLL